MDAFLIAFESSWLTDGSSGSCEVVDEMPLLECRSPRCSHRLQQPAVNASPAPATFSLAEEPEKESAEARVSALELQDIIDFAQVHSLNNWTLDDGGEGELLELEPDCEWEASRDLELCFDSTDLAGGTMLAPSGASLSDAAPIREEAPPRVCDIICAWPPQFRKSGLGSEALDADSGIRVTWFDIEELPKHARTVETAVRCWPPKPVRLDESAVTFQLALPCATSQAPVPSKRGNLPTRGPGPGGAYGPMLLGRLES